ncbi:LytTR family DNA-binding domain-containing protein [bacterium]|jgi:DNA-binding LytR/AlgR family response regulator|nr:LytTR family DNA-binding domain-containing protein [Bacteroidota bacterium]MDA7625642.1 LytTR family DNA-binding domain-containing protein [bacterium]MDF1864104.1 LytTR family DNA-binding domain-containing protein [Saprospiraceae bacterium]
MKNKAKLTCLIIEDEPIAAEVLKDYIQQVSFLDLKGVCKDAIFALDRLKEEKIDVLFLDIHLPKLKGLDFLKILKDKPQTILTTAYHQYALDAFEEEVVDYLMKPIEFSRFLKAVNKLNHKESQEVVPISAISENSRPFRFFNVNKKMVKVYFDEIQYIESLKDYSRIVTTDSSLTVRGQIGEMEESFKAFSFLRIHRSFIVPIEKIKAYSASEVEVEGKVLPIGRSYKQLVSERIRTFFVE